MSYYANTLQQNRNLLNSFGRKIIRLRWILWVVGQVLVVSKNPIKVYKGLREIIQLRDSVFGSKKMARLADARTWYHRSVVFPGFPSANIKSRIRNEIIRTFNNPKSLGKMETVIWGITNRCSLNCKHCYDWNNISNKENLSFQNLKEILFKLQAEGIKHIQLSGGEPLNRFNDLISIIEQGSMDVDFWLITSGFGLSPERAIKLKNAGLVGVNISLDHWDKDKHNEFRGNENSFDWVLKAVNNSLKAGLFVSLSLCATKEFVSEENLFKYAELARNLGAHYVRILEARMVGRYSKSDVLLDYQQIEILERFIRQISTNPDYSDYPIVNCVGLHQRKIGCTGAGDRYLYIDSKGDFHACPFCQGGMGNVFDTSIDDARKNLKKRGCHFQTNLQIA